MILLSWFFSDIDFSKDDSLIKQTLASLPDISVLLPTKFWFCHSMPSFFYVLHFQNAYECYSVEAMFFGSQATISTGVIFQILINSLACWTYLELIPTVVVIPFEHL